MAISAAEWESKKQTVKRSPGSSRGGMAECWKTICTRIHKAECTEMYRYENFMNFKERSAGLIDKVFLYLYNA